MMRHGFSLLLVLLCTAAGFAATPPAAHPRTMRLDYYHTGNPKQEVFSMDRVVLEPLPWPGDLQKAIDSSNLGNCLFEVRDKASDRLLYSRGFDTIFAEWVSTEEASHVTRTFSESVRFPAPDAPVKIILKARKDDVLREVWRVEIDPNDKFVQRSRPPSPGPLREIQKSGDPATKVDLLVLGDGYTAAERGKFEKDARKFIDTLFATSPFREHRQQFNVWGLCPAADESGISRPSSGIQRRSPLGASYDSFDSERYVLTMENRTLRDVASFAPYDFVEIIVNGATYGGGGIFNLYATVAADNAFSAYVGVHEFGHHFAGLADEYYTSDVAYQSTEKRPEPWPPNVTAMHDPANLKWKDLVEAGTPLPTPWNKEPYETFERDIQKQRKAIRAAGRPESEMEALFHKEQRAVDEMLGAEKYAGKIGAFEGANYEARGYYRPQLNCIMFTRTTNFCAVCRRGIERIIAMYAD